MAKTFSEKSTPLVSSKLTRSAEYIASAEEGARSALKAGMPSLAQAIIEDAMSIENLPEQKTKDLMLLLTDAYIAQGKFEAGIKTMDNVDMNESDNLIRLALIYIGLSNNPEAEKLLEKVDNEKVSKDMLSWLNVAKGYICYNKGDFRKALEFFKKAKTTIASQFVLADIMVAENLCKLSDTNANKKDFVSLENSLRENVKLYFGTPTGFQFAKQLAHILFKQGKRDEAV
jgi:tetratricopeptide (TPR) repeat protein